MLVKAFNLDREIEEYVDIDDFLNILTYSANKDNTVNITDIVPCFSERWRFTLPDFIHFLEIAKKRIQEAIDTLNNIKV